MEFNDYQEAIEKFCKYPHLGENGLVYPVLGLVGEIGEAFFDELGLLREKVDVYELGDVLFYAARILSHLNTRKETSSYGIFTAFYLSDCMKVVNKCATNISEATKKLIRDNNYKKVEIIIKETRTVIYNVEIIAKRHGWTLEEVLQKNYDKLDSRLQRGVIKGDGDHR
jgi:phosphoribosyl-ATP pyrophosphohydrolase